MGNFQSPNQAPFTKSQAPVAKDSSTLSIGSLLIKTSLLFIVFNLSFAWFNPMPSLGRISAYNWLFPGRQRLPFGEVQDKAYNLSLYQLDAMFHSHELAAPKTSREYRGILIGDSSVWGYLLKPSQTLAAFLNDYQLKTSDGKMVKFYNLGYPTIALTKDLLILSYAMAYQPDMVIWLTTLEALPLPKQLSSPIVQHNPIPVRGLFSTYNLPLNPQDSQLIDTSFWQRTIIGQRRALADLFRLQLYGVLWGATGVDQYYPATYEPPQADLEADERFHDLLPPTLRQEDLAFSIISAGIQIAGNRPVLLVNEPIYISQGENSNIRYNFFYPRWAYDQYRSLFTQVSQSEGWAYLDLWDLVPAGEFTNSAIHMSPIGTSQLASQMIPSIQHLLDQSYAP